MFCLDSSVDSPQQASWIQALPVVRICYSRLLGADLQARKDVWCFKQDPWPSRAVMFYVVSWLSYLSVFPSKTSLHESSSLQLFPTGTRFSGNRDVKNSWLRQVILSHWNSLWTLLRHVRASLSSLKRKCFTSHWLFPILYKMPLYETCHVHPHRRIRWWVKRVKATHLMHLPCKSPWDIAPYVVVYAEVDVMNTKTSTIDDRNQGGLGCKEKISEGFSSCWQMWRARIYIRSCKI